jgi:hypothetical protein
MRALFCTFLLLTACVSHKVRCDRHLQPINPPTPDAAHPVGLPGSDR